MPHTNRIIFDAPDHILGWFAFRVRPRHEKSVSLCLRDKGEECFVPLVRKKRIWANRVAYVELPLIVGYVLCRSYRFGMLSILKTPGVVDVVRVGNAPVAIPDAEMSALERAINAAVPIEPCPYVEVGQRVKIQSGPLAGVVGIVSDRKKSDQLILSVSLLRRSVLVQIDRSHLYDSDVPLTLIQSNETCLRIA